MPGAAPSTTSRRNGRQRPRLAATAGLTVLPGGRAPRPAVTITVSDLEGMQLELVAARVERTVYAAKMHGLIRHVARRIATAHYAAAGTSLLEMDRLTTQERDRAQAMEAAECPCGRTGSGHGPADDAVLAVPAEHAA